MDYAIAKSKWVFNLAWFLIIMSMLSLSSFAIAPFMTDASITPSYAYSDETILGYCEADDTDSTDLAYLYIWYKDDISYLTGMTYLSEYIDYSQDQDDGFYCTGSIELTHPCGNGTDLNWTTYVESEFGGGKNFYLYENYTIPSGKIKGNYTFKANVLTAIQFRISCYNGSDFELIQMYSATGWCDNCTLNVPDTCLDNGDGSIQMSVRGISYAGSYGARFYEGQIDWLNLSGYTPNVSVNVANLTANDTSIGDEFIFSCQAFDNEDYSSYLNSSALTINEFPDWVCSGYEACNISDLSPCNETTDQNNGTRNYTGDYSEFTPQVCNYCVADVMWVNQTECINNNRTTCYVDNNFATCCNITNITEDCPFSSGEGCVYASCMFFYDEQDIAESSINSIVLFLIAISILIPVIVISYITTWGAKTIKR